MAKITIHDIHVRDLCEGDVLNQQHQLNFQQFIQAAGQNELWIQQLIEYDIIQCPIANPQHHTYVGEDVVRARRAYRLQRDFDASLSAVAVMLDLIDEVQQLRRQLNYRISK